MLKESRKCDSSKTAYNAKSLLLNKLIESNLQTFEDFKKEREAKEASQLKLQALNEQLLQATKRSKSNWLVPTLIGFAGGLILGVSL